MPMTRNTRNLRNNPYMLDELNSRFHHSAAGALWRWRTELTSSGALTVITWRLAEVITLFWTVGLLGSLALAAMVIPGSRRFITRRAWCVLARHRLQKLCWEARLHTRSGRLPLILSIRPTKVGERARVLCRAGICAEDFEAHIGEITAACYARDARVTRHPRWGQLITVDIVRHDPLGTGQPIPSKVLAHRPPQLPRPPTTSTPGEAA